MVDNRFYKSAGPILLADLLQAAGAEELAAGLAANPMITDAKDADAAGTGDMVLLASVNFRDAVAATRADVVIAEPALAEHVPGTATVVLTKGAYALFARMLAVLYPDSLGASARMAAAAPHIDADARIEQNVTLGPGAVVGPGAEVGSGTILGPNAVIGPGVAIGRDCVIGANASVHSSLVGNRVIIHPGAQIGNEGFGFIPGKGRPLKIPQLGRVIVQDDVEIGASTTIDRGTLGDTVIGEGTKIDNLVQIGHNCRLGRNCQLAGTVAMAGSSTLGDHVLLGGGAAVDGYVHVGEGSVVHGRGVATRSCPPNSRLAGFPGRDAMTWRRQMAALARLAGRRPVDKNNTKD